MIFQSKYRNAVYIVRPTVRVVVPGYGVDIKPGLRAEFTGEQRLFDSVKSQEKFEHWTDEDRERVEQHLLKHKDFGISLYLAPGQELPDEYKKIAKTKKTEKRPRCAHVEFKDGEVSQCAEPVIVGTNYCITHDPSRVNITKGMVTAGGE